VRLVQHGVVLSEVRFRPGPTHSVADVIAAVLQALGAGPRLAVLGFAGGGMLGPLRALGGEQAVEAVDLDDSGWRLFQRFCGSWAGPVHFERAEAAGWLRSKRQSYDAVVEDLSIPRDADVFKPAATWSELPPLIYRRLRPGGVAIFNLLRPTVGLSEQDAPSCTGLVDARVPLGKNPIRSGLASWTAGVRQVVREGWQSRVVHFWDYENRLVIVGRSLPTPRQLARLLRGQLKGIRSRLTGRIAVR
jgi:hypothetical protein